MTVQSINIDVTAYLYDGCENLLNSFFEKVEDAIKKSKQFFFMDVEKTDSGVRMTGEIENEVEFIVDDYANYEGAGHYAGVVRQDDFMSDLTDLLKSIESEFCEIDDDSDFGEYEW